MYINFTNDRISLGDEAIQDTECGFHLVSTTDSIILRVKDSACSISFRTKKIWEMIIIVGVACNLRFNDLQSGEINEPKPETSFERVIDINRKVVSMTGFESASIENLLNISGGELEGLSNPGARARNDVRNRITNGDKSGTKLFADAFTPNPNGSQPAAAKRLAQQFQIGPANHQDGGIFGRFSPRPGPDYLNPGCSGGPRSITVVSNSSESGQEKVREFEAYDGYKAELSGKSENHLTSKHGHQFGINDPLSPLPNQKPTKYPQTRTRINNENKAKVCEEIQNILSNTNTTVYTNVSIRGIQGRVYICDSTNRVVGVHTEGEFAGEIKKAQLISDKQLEILQALNKLD